MRSHDFKGFSWLLIKGKVVGGVTLTNLTKVLLISTSIGTVDVDNRTNGRCAGVNINFKARSANLTLDNG